MYKFLALASLVTILGIAQGARNSCNKAGPMCSDCDHQALCIDLGLGLNFNQIESKCAEGTKCLNGTCTEGAMCNYRPFTCNDIGNFPDPWDCKKHHVCVVDQASGEYTDNEIACTSGSYDSATATCGYPMNTDACVNAPVPSCTASLQIGALKSDPSTYYICVDDGSTIAPEMFRCTGGRIFDESKTSCVATSVKKSKKVK